MERYTEKLEDGRNVLKENYAYVKNPKHGSFVEGKAIDKLAEYEDAEEQGLLHKAPLKNGTLIWFFVYGFDEGPYLTSGTYLYGVKEYEIGEFKKDFWLSEEDALLVKEEAEQALKQMGE